MFTVIIPFIAREVASDWGRAVLALERTLGSILANTEENLRVFVVCQDQPPVKIQDNRYLYIKSSYPIPDKNDIMAKHGDKGYKLHEAFEFVRQFFPEYVMFCDADDLVSNKLISYVQARPSFDAFCFKSGYVWREGEDFLTKISRFNQVCATAFVMRYNDRLFPGWLTGDWDRMIGELGHHQIEEAMDKASLKIDKNYSPMAVYVTGHGNHLGDFNQLSLKKRIKDLLLAPIRRYEITDSLREEFGIQKSGMSNFSTF